MKNSWIMEKRPEYGGQSISERIQSNGASCLSNKELISLIIGASTTKVDDKNLEIVCELVENKNISFNSLEKIIGEKKALSLLSSIELSNRFNKGKNFSISSPEDTFNLVRHYAFNCEQEKFIVIVLDGGHKVLEHFVATVGLVNRALIHPREVFSRAIMLKATDIIIAHNHPSGNLDASREDITTTSRLCESANILGIRILDHIIFTENDYYSMREHNLF